MNIRIALVSSRLLFGTLVLAAIIIQASYLYQNNALNVVNYFSYFTNLSNILAGIILIISAFYLLKSRKSSKTDDLIRGGATLYMAVTGVVYITLLINEDLGLLMPWINAVLHIVMPVVVIADWLYQPPRTKLTSKQIAYWLAFPLAFLVYTLVRGAVINWYPYPFLNPEKVGGYGGVAIYCVGILGAFFILGWLLIKISQKFHRHVA
jgi:hypothetical protein